MVATATKVVNAGLAGATDLARIPLEEKWPEPHLVMGEYISTVVRGMVTQAGIVAQSPPTTSRRRITPRTDGSSR